LSNAAPGYQAVLSGAGALTLSWDVVSVHGPDAQRYLQGQLSQDISGLVAGASVWSLVLQPQGKLVALVRAYRRSGEEFLLVTDAGVGPALVERLKRFLLRTKAEVEEIAWRAVSVRGPAADIASAGRAGAAGEALCAVPFSWGGLVGYDLFGDEPLPPAGALVASVEEYEAARIEAGFPRHGAELDERTIPAEAGLVEASVSFTKGCYTGQELIARIDARGSHVPRRLRGFLLEGPAQPGSALHELPSLDAKVAGRLTSVARSPRFGWVALGYASRGVELGQRLYAGTGEGFVASEVRLLPLAPS